MGTGFRIVASALRALRSRVDAAGVDAAATRAASSGIESTSREERAAWLEALAAALEADRGELVAIAHRETHLSETRLDGEVTRTAAQLRFFAGVAREGSYLEATLDSPDPSTIPPRPDLRRMLRPLGPVAVFTASNFPFAFSVLGNDTASALAAGCAVVVKAHPGHPELSRRTAGLAVAALASGGRARRRSSRSSKGWRRAWRWCSIRRSLPSDSPDRCAAGGRCSTWRARGRRRSRSTGSWGASTRSS